MKPIASNQSVQAYGGNRGDRPWGSSIGLSLWLAHGGSHGQPSPAVTEEPSEAFPSEAETGSAPSTSEASDHSPGDVLGESVKPSFGFHEVVFLLLIVVPIALYALKDQRRKSSPWH